MFLEHFANDKTPAMLLKELGSLKMEGKEKVKGFNQRFTRILNKFVAETKTHDSIIVDYYTSALPTTIVQFTKWVVKPTVLARCKEAIVFEKEFHAIGVIKDEETTKDSKDASRKPQAMTRKGRDKEATDIETLTLLVKKLTTEISELKKRKTGTFVNSHQPRWRQKRSSLIGSSRNNRFGSKSMQKPMFQLDQCVDPKYYSFHEEFHPENSCSNWKQVVTSVYAHKLDVDGDIHEQSEDTDDNKEVSHDEAPCFGHVENAYKCSQVVSKMNTEKRLTKKNDRYNLRSKEVPPTLEDMQEKVRWLIKKADPPATWKQQTQSKSGKTMADKNTFVRNKLQNSLPDNTSICSTPDTSVILPPLDYNIVDDMKKTKVNISLFELAKVQS